MQRTFFVGDIHGCCKTFKKMITDKIDLQKTDVLYCVGDYIDRGPDGKGVVDFILELKKNNYQVHTLRGNHEQMLLDARRGGKYMQLWTMNGGYSTLESFGVIDVNDLKAEYMDFFKQTLFFVETEEFIVVHAGLNFDAEDPYQDKEAMLWIRNYSPDPDFLKGRLLIHGHTPRPREYILSQEVKNRVNIDAGCVYKDMEGMASLIALDFNKKKFIEVGNID